MKAAASNRRDRLRAMLADLKMPGALEALDGGRRDRAGAQRPDRAAQQPSPAGRHAFLAPAGRQDAGAV